MTDTKVTLADLDFVAEQGHDYQITLSKDYQILGATSATLTMREPTVQDLLASEMQAKGKSDAEQEIMMFANLCGVPPEAIKGLTLRDYKRVQSAYKLFIE
ncbi:Phage tail assembly chaperone protein, E, or 41 or 14 [Acinetobacter marinus]|uniref:Phage tail assembly chaperone protein, E, or 41 or 14 n=1 Tax=Acinetobacter marinus TaxID=281375 RepID=A0A1G6JG81_9GAMM|nr:phage tail assembly protein [Acinetobacter marinus]MEC8887370.1 phage tail assembly protein [Pseudomonadota bacterium]SDC16936.1 Phage tail assembly chaperone protein, E, or 41 or 14 [Acinetobacter marinus]